MQDSVCQASLLPSPFLFRPLSPWRRWNHDTMFIPCAFHSYFLSLFLLHIQCWPGMHRDNGRWSPTTSPSHIRKKMWMKRERKNSLEMCRFRPVRNMAVNVNVRHRPQHTSHDAKTAAKAVPARERPPKFTPNSYFLLRSVRPFIQWLFPPFFM